MGSEYDEEIRKQVQADSVHRASPDDPVAAKIKALLRSNRRFLRHDSAEPAYRGIAFDVMAIAMCAGWNYSQEGGKHGDDFEFWFRECVQEHFVDGQLVNIAPEILACAEFVVEQIMAIANESYGDHATSEWAYHDIARLCARLSEARIRAKAKRAGAGDSA